jgi:hypothetical protein
MSQARALSSEEVRGLQEELAAGGTPTVWFTPSAVGVPEGRSGKVISLDDSVEGDFIQVRPAGSKDVLSFSAGEVTVVKPPRKRKEPEGAQSSGTKAASKPAPATQTAKAPESTKAPETAKASETAKPAKASTVGEPTKSASRGGTQAAGGGARATSGSGSGSGSGGARRKPRQLSGATVTLTADEAGQWSVEVSTGKKRVLRPTSVPASAVAQAAKTLHDDVADAVEPLLEAAREQHRARVEQLQQELADAQRALEELTE